MISASGFFRGWTTWTTGWASKNEDLLPRYLVLSISNNTKANLIQPVQPTLICSTPNLIVDHHDHSLCFPSSSFLVYPRRKLFSSWKVCKCKTASLSDRGGNSLKRGNTHKHKEEIWILNRTNISSFKPDFLILLSADERFSRGIRFSQLFEWSLLINCLRGSDWSDNPITRGHCSLFIRTSCTEKLWLNIIHFSVIQKWMHSKPP